MERLFDHVDDIAFFIKDDQFRYLAVNQTLLTRCGLSDRDDLLGKTAAELFPTPLGESFIEEDDQVMREARGLHGQLKRHLYPDGREDWCLTNKEPLFDTNGLVIGLVGISRDLIVPTLPDTDLQGLSQLLDHIRESLDKPLRLEPLAASAGLSVYQLDQRIRALFQLSAGQYITKARIDAACHQLTKTSTAIANIALDCGYADQSAFTRQFKQSVGLTPGAYRERARQQAKS
jgi:PAS domain S-box-containing protein